MTEIKQVNVSVSPLSFCFFFSPYRLRWGVGGGGGGSHLSWRVMSFLWNHSGLHHVETELWFVLRGGGSKSERLEEGGGDGVMGWGLYCYTVQCRLESNYSSTRHMTHEEKERERRGPELHEQMRKMDITQLCRWVWLRFWRFCVGFLHFLCVRVTVWAGAPLSLCLTCVREASKRQLPVNWSAGRLGAARHWVKSSEVRRSCVSCRWRLGG